MKVVGVAIRNGMLNLKYIRQQYLYLQLLYEVQCIANDIMDEL